MYWCVPWISSAASREETNLHGREPGEVHLQSSQGIETLGQISLGCIQLGDVSKRKSINQTRKPTCKSLGPILQNAPPFL